jgi:LCP family protein required for cell wall assembly
MFEHLDDDLEFRSDPTLRAAVRRDGRRRRARRRGAATAGALAVPVALTAGVFTAVGRLRPQPVAVDAAGQVDASGAPAQLNTDDLFKPFTLLAVGTDARADVEDSRRTDTIMLIEVDHPAGRIRVLSLPRDLYVAMADGSGRAKLNQALEKGREHLIATVNQALGVTVDHYAETDFSGFAALVDAVGGIAVVSDAGLRDRASGLNLDPGCHTLDGVTALALARARHLEVRTGTGPWTADPTSDYGRMARQQMLARAAIARAGHLGAGPAMLTLANALLRHLKASAMDPRQTGQLTLWAGSLDAGAIQTMTLDTRERRVDGMDVLEPVPGAEVTARRFLAGEAHIAGPPVGAPAGAAPVIRPAAGGAC